MKGFLSMAAGLLHVVGKKGLGALLTRLAVYILGFGAVFLMAAKIPPALFGRYSIYQASLEFGLIFASLGSSIIFARRASQTPATVHLGDMLQTMVIGLPFAVAVTLTTLSLQNEALNLVPISIFLVTMVVFTFNMLGLAYSRGRGSSGLLNAEAGIRAVVLMSGVGILLWSGTVIDLNMLLAVNLVGAVLMCATIILSNGKLPTVGPATLRLGEQCGAAFYSLVMFSLRKADLLVVAFFMPLPYVAAYKIAFVLAEAPSQFIQAYLYTRTLKMLEVRRLDGTQRMSQEMARHSLFLGCGLFAGVVALISLFSDLLKIGPEARHIFMAMLPYFLLRTYTVHNEMLLQLHSGMNRLGHWAGVELALKSFSYLVCFHFFPSYPHYVFFLAFIYEFLLLEIRMKMAWGHFPILRLFRSTT